MLCESCNQDRQRTPLVIADPHRPLSSKRVCALIIDELDVAYDFYRPVGRIPCLRIGFSNVVRIRHMRCVPNSRTNK